MNYSDAKWSAIDTAGQVEALCDASGLYLELSNIPV